MTDCPWRVNSLPGEDVKWREEKIKRQGSLKLLSSSTSWGSGTELLAKMHDPTPHSGEMLIVDNAVGRFLFGKPIRLWSNPEPIIELQGHGKSGEPNDAWMITNKRLRSLGHPPKAHRSFQPTSLR